MEYSSVVKSVTSETDLSLNGSLPLGGFVDFEQVLYLVF